MRAHETETAFLRHIVLYDDSDEGRKLERSIAQVQHDANRVQRVASVTALFPPLAIVGLAYGVLLQENYPYNGSELVFRVLCVLGLASVICLVGLASLLTVYRKKLHRLRKQARQSVVRLLESRLGKPQVPALPSSQRVLDDREASQDATEVSDYPEIASLT
jgi:hypothetical protein